MTEINKLIPRDFVGKFKQALLDDSIQNILVRGYIDNEKILLVFDTLQNLADYQTGSVVMGRVTVRAEREYLVSGLSSKCVPRFNLKDDFTMCGLKVNFTKLDQNIDHEFNIGKDFAIFHPVESVLFDDSSVEKFRKVLKNSKAKKNILLTTNDLNKDPEKIYDDVESVLILDSRDVDDKHRQKYKTIEYNLTSKGNKLPY
ncbi:hypothetical protein [Ligilactobacillus saerimneri]|uniref:hypothetical protein n=1 Tax=Ligilactobacillus saerimneri TaxID=228229 RepID=UPI00209EC608|nr:hypothetical protein [Ligilactobacillus saerimneri]